MAARRPTRTPSPPSTFADLGVPAPLTRVLAAAGVVQPFPIQTAALPDALAGRDVLGRGRTGSGKTYAFLLPLLTRLAASPVPRRPTRRSVVCGRVSTCWWRARGGWPTTSPPGMPGWTPSRSP